MSPPLDAEAARQGKHVYIIDDDHSVRTSLARALEKFGYDVHKFENAEAFQAHAFLFRPAVLLIDIQMPGMNGVQLQARLQEMGWRVPVVFISGESSLSQGITAMKQGAMDFLIKPFDLDRLVFLIEMALTQDAQQLKTLAQQEWCAKQLEQLKPREKEAYFCLAKGFSYDEMMGAMGISKPTAKQYRAAVMRQLKFASLAELIQFHQALTANKP